MLSRFFSNTKKRLLSHTAKQLKPTVIYNDFDGYTEWLKHIDDTNQLRQIIFNYLHGIIKTDD